METKGTVLYVGGFELPDKNAAAQRVIGIAKGLREIGYTVIFLNSLKCYKVDTISIKEYFGFKCYEYRREKNWDYLVSATTALINIKRIKPDIVIAYNYPGFALNKIREHCKENHIKCIADATEWYIADEGTLLYRLIKTIDTSYRMRIVQKKMDGVIAISRFLYEFYKKTNNAVIIPPTVDIADSKWKNDVQKDKSKLTFIYAGSPSVQKECLDLIVRVIEKTNFAKETRLNIVGITKEQFIDMYNWKDSLNERIHFYGRISHLEAIELTKKADWTIVLRNNNLVVKAGFPTKVVESISCGTPVIVNRFSNISDFINEENGLLLDKPESFNDSIFKKTIKEMKVDIMEFDYNRFIDKLRLFMSHIQ